MMLNYKKVAPIALVLLFVLSAIYLVNTRVTTKRNYEEILASARVYSEKKLYADAMETYNKAYELMPSPELGIEITELVRTQGPMRETEDWYELILASYPRSVDVYEYLMERYHEMRYYSTCFSLRDQMNARKLKSEKTDAIIQSILYTYMLDGDYRDVKAFSGGACPVYSYNKWGAITQTGTLFLNFQFKYVGAAYNGLVPIITLEDEARFIDQKGNTRQYANIYENPVGLGSLYNGFYTVGSETEWSLVNKENQVLMTAEAMSCIADDVFAAKRDGHWYLYSATTQQPLSSSGYEGLIANENSQIFCQRVFTIDGGVVTMRDNTGNAVGGQTYEDAKLFTKNGTLAAVKVGGAWGFVDVNGTMTIAPQYEDARSFSYGYAAVKQDGVWNFINTNGEVVINGGFEEAYDMNGNGGAMVRTEDGWSLMRLYQYNH